MEGPYSSKESAAIFADDILSVCLGQKSFELKPFKKKNSWFKLGLYATGIIIYFLMPPAMFGLAYRLYWRHGLFWTTEHLVLLVVQFITTLLTWTSHYQGHTCDPGFVLPHHFREADISYEIQGSSPNSLDTVSQYKEC